MSYVNKAIYDITFLKALQRSLYSEPCQASKMLFAKIVNG